MLRIVLLGRTGNHLFQYALGRVLAEKHGVPLVLDASWFNAEGWAEVSHFLRLPLKARVVRRCSIGARALRKASGKHYWEYRGVPVLKEAADNQSFDPRFLEAPADCVLFGYFQTPRYFERIAGELREEIKELLARAFEKGSGQDAPFRHVRTSTRKRRIGFQPVSEGGHPACREVFPYKVQAGSPDSETARMAVLHSTMHKKCNDIGQEDAGATVARASCPEPLHSRLRLPHAVAVHVRRGDYLNHPVFRVCDESYYRSGMDDMRARVAAARFFVFSDDPDWCRATFKDADTEIVDSGEAGLNPLHDLYLMSLAGHHLIANSTYSWWAAWLGDKPGQQVIMPERWYAHGIHAPMEEKRWK